jgi:hypothetical protein
MYIFVAKKSKGSKLLPLPLLLDGLYDRLGKGSFAYCLPGYMSTNESQIESFQKRFPWKTPDNAFFQYGMNGRHKMKGIPPQSQCKDLTIHWRYNQESINDFCNPLCLFLPGGKIDHSKVIFFLNDFSQNDVVFKTNETKEQIIAKLREKKPQALLIGSSNQSNLTYYRTPTSKGETDVLLVLGSVFNYADNVAFGFNKKINDKLKENFDSGGKRKGSDKTKGYSGFAFSVLSKEVKRKPQSKPQSNVIQDFWNYYLDELFHDLCCGKSKSAFFPFSE